jgi:hypothetical protein
MFTTSEEQWAPPSRPQWVKTLPTKSQGPLRVALLDNSPRGRGRTTEDQEGPLGQRGLQRRRGGREREAETPLGSPFRPIAQRLNTLTVSGYSASDRDPGHVTE